MKKPLFTQSFETIQLVEALKEMSIGQTISFSEISKKVGFSVNSSSPAYHSARRVLTRDHSIILESVRGFGFQRLDGHGMVNRGGRLLKGVRRRARRGAQEMEIALMQNLNRNDQLRASQQLTRFKLTADIARTPPVTNREETPEPDLISSFATRPRRR